MPALPEPDALHLRVEGLEVASPRGRTLLRVPALSVPPRQSVAIRGASGAGKSTLLHVLSGLLRASAGTVRWGTIDLMPLSEEARARFRRDHIGMIFQDFLLFEELDALGNAALAGAFAASEQRAGLRQRARNWLTRLGLGETGTRRADSFSGGERQRIAVARALCNAPSIILADEPTASLDRSAADRLIADLVALSRDQGCSLIAVTHDAALAAHVDRVLLMADGRIVEDSHG